MLSPGALTTLEIEKPAAGGRMIARAEGLVVLVAGAIPGERVQARITRIGKGVAYADTVTVDGASDDRRDPFVDPFCAGCLYAHISYLRQLDLKRDVILDALARIGRIEWPERLTVEASPESGYRMRARLHVRSGRAGFFREGTHDLCDAGATRQLIPESIDAVNRLIGLLGNGGIQNVLEMEISENVDGSERAIHLVVGSVGQVRALTSLDAANRLERLEGISGVTVGMAAAGFGARDAAAHRIDLVSGDAFVHDTIRVGSSAVRLRRHVMSFFQGNRFLLEPLVAHVVGSIHLDGPLTDLYAGVGLFASCAAAAHPISLTAVEGDRIAADDLQANLAPLGERAETIQLPVETFLKRERQPPRTLIVDPPRTGMSREAMDGVLRLKAPRVVYVSCDVATLARDARRLIDVGYAIRDVKAFDLFPNTPHVETVVRFDLP
jgi:23S rRNA (uracil1939-C5)-methyltransferase